MKLSVPREDAVRAVLEGLPKDAIVREEDDGLGRFAGDRTVVIVARGRSRLLMFRATYGSIKGRLETPQLDVVFEDKKKGVLARVTPETIAKPTIASHLMGFVGNAVTVAALVVAYFFLQKQPVDVPLTAAIGGGGGLLWSVVAAFMPKSVDTSLDRVVRDALAPMAVQRKAARAKDDEPDAADPA